MSGSIVYLERGVLSDRRVGLSKGECWLFVESFGVAWGVAMAREPGLEAFTLIVCCFLKKYSTDIEFYQQSLFVLSHQNRRLRNDRQ